MNCDGRSCDLIREKPTFLCPFPFLSPIRYPPSPPCGSRGPSLIWGSKCILPCLENDVCDCSLRPLFKIGLVWIEILRRLLIPTWCGATAVVYAKKKEEPTCDEGRKLVKASELPLYTDDKKCGKCETKEDLKPSLLIESISCARKELWFLMDQARIISDQAMEYVDVAKAHSETALDFLREESNVVPRIGAIGIGGLTGFIVGLRRGPIRRIFYSSLGAAAIAALAYPKEAEEYTYMGLRLARKYVIIGYHFLNGVSRDLTGYQLPRLGGRLGFEEAVDENSVVISDNVGRSDALTQQVHVPSSTRLLPPTAGATHIVMPHEHQEEIKKHPQKQSHPNDKDL